MTESEHLLRENEPLAGSLDHSPCLESWIKTLDVQFRAQGGFTLSHGAVSNLLHTLICGKLRVERLIRERDELKKK